MNLRALTVCVDYSDLLIKGLERWEEGLDQLLVVTSSADKATRELCCRLGVDTHVTDIFYANGARFNKGAALAEAVHVNRLREGADWLLVFDADIVPLPGWRMALEALQPQPGFLYGAQRYQVPEDTAQFIEVSGQPMVQKEIYGFFMLFHAGDPLLPPIGEPLFEMCWGHAGCYDTQFLHRWRPGRDIILPLPVFHLGDDRRNWLGRRAAEQEKQSAGTTHAKLGKQFKQPMKRPPVLPQL